MTRPSKASKRPKAASPTPSASAWRMKGSRSPEAIAADNVTRSTGDCPLVMIEWEDSAQPIPSWSYLASFEPPGIIMCASVGWLIHDGDEIKALAPNMGAINESSVQISGLIQISTRCVRRVTMLKEPRLSAL